MFALVLWRHLTRQNPPFGELYDCRSVAWGEPGLSTGHSCDNAGALSLFGRLKMLVQFKNSPLS